MTLDEMRIRIAPMHNDMLRRMLGVNELPEPLLRRYFGIKRIIDKVDGALSTSDLLRLALDCGLNIDTLRFEDEKPVEKIIEKPVERVPSLIAVNEKLRQEDTDDPYEVPEVNDPYEDYDLDEALEPDDEPDVLPEAEPVKKEVLAIGQPVEVFHDGDIVRGLINGSKEEYGETVYSVELEDEIIEVPEKDVQEV